MLDASYYPSDLRIPGIEDTNEAYDALNSALAVNFNTIHAVRRGNTVRSAEKQTPITPLAISQFRARGPKGRGRISLSQGPRGEPAIRRRAARRVHRAGRRQREGQDLDRIRARGPEPGLRSPPVAHPFGDPRPSCSSPRTTTSPTRSSWRSAGTARRSVSLEKSLKVARDDARRARPRRGHPSRGGLGHQPRQPLHGARPRQGARPLRAPRRACSTAATAA